MTSSTLRCRTVSGSTGVHVGELGDGVVLRVQDRGGEVVRGALAARLSWWCCSCRHVRYLPVEPGARQSESGPGRTPACSAGGRRRPLPAGPRLWAGQMRWIGAITVRPERSQFKQAFDRHADKSSHCRWCPVQLGQAFDRTPVRDGRPFVAPPPPRGGGQRRVRPARTSRGRSPPPMREVTVMASSTGTALLTPIRRLEPECRTGGPRLRWP